MRIIGGKYRGKKLYSPEGKNVRPTSERAREAIFNILFSHINEAYENLDLADIFAGTGAFGLEAVSRGFKSVTFVDINTNTIEKNVKMFPQDQQKFNILQANAIHLPVLKKSFHLVFMDAPYAKGLSQKVLHELITKNWLQEKALCIVEIRADEQIEIPSEFELIDQRNYGLAKVLFLQKTAYESN